MGKPLHRHIVWGSAERFSSSLSDSDDRQSEVALPEGVCIFSSATSDTSSSSTSGFQRQAYDLQSQSEQGKQDLTSAAATLGPSKQPEWSEGSSLHHLGQCRGCVHFWKPQGCVLGSRCDFCHLCTEEEGTQRRLERIQAQKAAKKAAGKRSAASSFREPRNTAPPAPPAPAPAPAPLESQVLSKFVSMHKDPTGSSTAWFAHLIPPPPQEAPPLNRHHGLVSDIPQPPAKPAWPADVDDGVGFPVALHSL